MLEKTMQQIVDDLTQESLSSFNAAPVEMQKRIINSNYFIWTKGWKAQDQAFSLDFDPLSDRFYAYHEG